jgi:hypothetical protein
MKGGGAFTDYQVLSLIRDHPGCTIYSLLKYARSEMPKWNWSRGKVHKAVQRLKRDKKIDTRLRVNGSRSCQELYCRTV